MPKRRVSRAKSQTTKSRRTSGKKAKKLGLARAASIVCSRFVGVSLRGGKSDRTCVAVLEYFPNHAKIFLHQLYERLGGDADKSADANLIGVLEELAPNLNLIALDTPLNFPPCVPCRLKCPGIDDCKVPQVIYMREIQSRVMKENKNAKPITPYTQRPVEIYIQKKLERPYAIQDALGANEAPLTARAHYILRRLGLTAIEVFPELSFARIGEQLEIPSKYFKSEYRIHDLEEARQIFVNALVKRNVFIYQQDIQKLVENPDAFAAFLTALTAFLSSVGECESRPSQFPSRESFIQIPKQDLSWDVLSK